MNKKRLWFVGLLVSLLGAGVWQGPALSRAWQTNQMALAAMEVCTGQQDLSAIAKAPPFLQAGAAQCVGDEELASEIYFETTGAQARIAILHSAMPFSITLARQVITNHSDIAEGYFWLGEALMANFQTQRENLEIRNEAILAYEDGLRFDRENGMQWYKLGQLYEASGNWEKAVNAYNQACFYIDIGGNGCLHAGRVYLQHGRYEQAILRYQDSLLRYPDSAPQGLIDAFIALGRVDEAIPFLQKRAAQGDSDAQAQLEQLQMLP